MRHGLLQVGLELPGSVCSFTRLTEVHPLVLICDQVSRLTIPSEMHILMALKASRDRVNLRPGTNVRFIFVATDADVTVLRRCVMDPEQAFFGATVEALPKAEDSLYRLDAGEQPPE